MVNSQNCHICGDRASVYCENDHQYFCPSCDFQAHDLEQEDPYDSKNKKIKQMLQAHVRVPI